MQVIEREISRISAQMRDDGLLPERRQGYDSDAHRFAGCRGWGDALCMVTCYAIVWVPILWAVWP